MADSIQLQILKTLTTLLEGANPTNEDPGTGEPYALDMRDKVFRGRTEFGQDVILPAFSILESPVPVESLHAGEGGVKKKENWRLLLQGFGTDDKLNPTDPAYMLKAVAEQRLARIIAEKEQGLGPLFPDDYLLGNLITGLKIPQGVVRPPEKQISATAFFYIPLIIEMTTDTRNPYAG